MDRRFQIRRRRFTDLVSGFAAEYSQGLAFLAGWTAYPIGIGLLSLLGIH